MADSLFEVCSSVAPETTFSRLVSMQTQIPFCALNAETKATELLPGRSVYEHNFLYATYSVLMVGSASSSLKVHIVISPCCTGKTLHGQQDIACTLTTAIPKVLEAATLSEKGAHLKGYYSNIVLHFDKVWVLTTD